jgi:hypothetical protein
MGRFSSCDLFCFPVQREGDIGRREYSCRISTHNLGISRRVVAQHIYGIRRDGKRVGGGIKKIKRICEERGISL